MSKILLVSISCPPKSDPESIQVGRYLKYLSENDFEIEVLTSTDPTLYMETDPAFTKYLDGVSKIYKRRLLENRYTNFLIRKIIPSALQYPDTKWSFYFGSHPKIEKPDLIYSRSYPLSSTLMALKLKKKWNVPWLLHLSDPWAQSYDGDSPASHFKTKPKRWNQKKEMESFSLASKVSFTSIKTKELYELKYPQFVEKFIITPNVFDPADLNIEPISFSGTLTILYSGGFGEKRSPMFYLKTIRKFLNENPLLRKSIKFLFTGPMTRENHRIFQKFKKYEEIEHLGTIPYIDMINYQRNAHVLVNIDSDIHDPLHSVFFPSKLLEYFGANRRVLAICNQHSTTHHVINNVFGDCVEFNDSEKLLSLFGLYYKNFHEKKEEFFRLSQSIDQYDATVNVKSLTQTIEEMIKKTD